MSTMIWINASDFCNWTYCHRQYFLKTVRHLEPHAAKRATLAAGTRAHVQHGQRMVLSRTLMRAAAVALALALAALAWALLSAAAYPKGTATTFHVPPIAGAIALALVVLAILLNRFGQRVGRTTGLPTAGDILHSDTHTRNRKPLRDPQTGLLANPDYILPERLSVFRTQRVACEVKPHQTASTPYPDHILQLLAEVLVVSANYRDAAPYGYLAYRDYTFQEWLTPDNRTRLLATADAMRAAHDGNDVHRDHNSPRKCAACGFNDRCTETLTRT